MGLNSRRDTICLSSTPSSLLLGISPTHPSILPSLPICFDSVLYLPATTGIHPPIHSLTMLLGDHWQEARVKEKKPKFTLSINIKASILLQTSYTSCLLHIQQEAHQAFYLMHHADSLLLWKEDSLRATPDSRFWKSFLEHKLVCWRACCQRGIIKWKWYKQSITWLQKSDSASPELEWCRIGVGFYRPHLSLLSSEARSKFHSNSSCLFLSVQWLISAGMSVSFAVMKTDRNWMTQIFQN